MEHKTKLGLECQIAVKRNCGHSSQIVIPRARYDVECRREGILVWKDYAENLVTNEGINDLLKKYFKGSAYTAAFYIGVVQGATPTFANNDTAATHPGWTEYTTYAEAVRQTLILPASFTGTSVDNSASRATVTCSGANNTVSGAFIITDNAKSGTAGVLYSEALFTQGNKLVGAGDVLSILVTLSGATQ